MPTPPTELVTMSAKEIDRLSVIQRVRDGRLSQKKAAEMTGLSTPEGCSGYRPGCFGRSSNFPQICAEDPAYEATCTNGAWDCRGLIIESDCTIPGSGGAGGVGGQAGGASDGGDDASAGADGAADK